MGYVCAIPVIKIKGSFSSFLSKIKLSHNLATFAAVIDNDSKILNKLRDISSRWCCVMGNEGNGISIDVVDVCDTKIKISISDNVDSLSVGVATGILLNGLKERELILP